MSLILSLCSFTLHSCVAFFYFLCQCTMWLGVVLLLLMQPWYFLGMSFADFGKSNACQWSLHVHIYFLSVKRNGDGTWNLHRRCFCFDTNDILLPVIICASTDMKSYETTFVVGQSSTWCVVKCLHPRLATTVQQSSNNSCVEPSGMLKMGNFS